MYLGRLVESGPAREVFRHPQHPYTRMLLDAIPDLEMSGRRRIPVAGEVPSPISPRPVATSTHTARSRTRAAAPRHRCRLPPAPARSAATRWKKVGWARGWCVANSRGSADSVCVAGPGRIRSDSDQASRSAPKSHSRTPDYQYLWRGKADPLSVRPHPPRSGGSGGFDAGRAASSACAFAQTAARSPR
jgi:oligopeptide/dipeptide ABC transporter ATP-binding protein